MSNLVSKITMKSVCGAPAMQTVETVGEDGVKKTVLRGVEKQYMRLVGVARGSENITSQYGDSIKFLGDFRAVNLETGEIFNAGQAFLPNIAETYLYNVLENVRHVDGFSGLELAFDIGVKPASTPMGYEYTVKPLIEPATKDDHLSNLLDSLPPLALTSQS